jgi:murein DD-endopeptidase MepM/ murein hydrolase activator NlpD
LISAFSATPSRAIDDVWPTHAEPDAAFAFDYPPESVIQISQDASLAYPIVYVTFPAPKGNDEGYQGASIMVLQNNPERSLTAFVRNARGNDDGAIRLRRNDGRAALALVRDAILGAFDAQTTLIQGDGVIYRINLFGGGKAGEVEPTAQARAYYDRLVRSFQVLEQTPQPGPQRTPASAERIAAQSASTADVFSWPLRGSGGVDYGVPVGIIADDTRLEWLDYGIRNLDQWRVKCYGVDWSRMLHTGEDWYRLDYLTRNSAGTPVYAVANGVVVRHNPSISYPGNVVVIRHTLPDGRNIYSMYGHITNVSVVVGDSVVRGQQIATILNQGYVGRTPGRHPSWDSHLHFEIRWMMDAGNIYVLGTNEYGYNYPSCTWLYPGRGYTYRIHPNNYPYRDNGYVDPSDFIAARLAPDTPPLDSSGKFVSLQPAQATPEPSATVTVTATSTPDPTPSPTATGTPTPIATATISPSGTVTPLLLLPILSKPRELLCSNLARNGGFESSGAWVGIANTAGTIYNEPVYSAARAHTGARSGLIGSLGVNGYWNEILQTVMMPTGTISATLSYWRYLSSGETSVSVAYDVFRIGLETERGIEIVAPKRIDNTSAGRNTWVRESIALPDVGNFYGQRLWITAKGATDGNRPSGLYLDDVEFTACRYE